MKKRLVVSFSGGETSAFMAQWILANKSEEFEMIFVFANTGQENEETLRFAEKCSKHFGFSLVWVEAVTNPINGKGVTARVVDFKTASRNGEPFEAMIAKHGIPNTATPHCSRELKRNAIKAYCKSIGWNTYYTAIGIRVDELDRVAPNWEKERLKYFLITDVPTRKTDINAYWARMPFRLNLMGYEGNCKVCWKKSLRKLMTIALENPAAFDFFKQMEDKYGNYTPDSRKHNEKIKPPHRFFREKLSTVDILKMSESYFEKAIDDSQEIVRFKQMVLDLDMAGGCIESCEVY